MRLRLARSPRTRHERAQFALAQKVQPFAIRREGGRRTVHALARYRRDFTRPGTAELDLRVGVRGRRREREPLAVGRPREVVEFIVETRFNQLCRLRLQIPHPELTVFIIPGDPFSVRRNDWRKTEDRSVLREQLRCTDPICRKSRKLDLTRFVGLSEQRLSVGKERRIAKAHAVLVRHRDKAQPRLHWRDKHVAARREHDAVSIRRNVCAREIGERLLHPALPHLIQIGGKRDRDRSIGLRCDGEQSQVGAVLIHDAAVVDLCGFRIETLVLRERLHVGAVGFHRPQIADSRAVAQKIHAALPPQRVF